MSGGYNSSVANQGSDLDVLLGKIKDATPATTDTAGVGGLIPAPPAGSENGSKVLLSSIQWGDAVYDPKYIDLSIFSESQGTLTDEQYQSVVDAYNSKSSLALYQGYYIPATIGMLKGMYDISATYISDHSDYSVAENIQAVEVNPTDKSYIKHELQFNDIAPSYFDYLQFMRSTIAVTTLANIPNSHNVIANVTAATDLSVYSQLEEGRDIQVRVNNTTASVIIQTIPTTGSYDCLDGTSVEIPANGFIELNIWKIGGINVIRIGQKQ